MSGWTKTSGDPANVCAVCDGNYRSSRYEEHTGSIKHRRALTAWTERIRLEREAEEDDAAERAARAEESEAAYEIDDLYATIPEIVDAVEASLAISDPTYTSMRLLAEIRAVASK